MDMMVNQSVAILLAAFVGADEDLRSMTNGVGYIGRGMSYVVLMLAGEIVGAQYAPLPNDQYVRNQFHLEFRDAQGSVLGANLNVREAWPITRGAGVTIAVADVGIELDHPDLVTRTAGAPHRNFYDETASGTPFGTNAFWSHGTSVGGLAAASHNNLIGVSGAAPEAMLASWVVFQTNRLLVSEVKLGAMYMYASNVVDVQVHAWTRGNEIIQSPLGPEEDAGVQAAITSGRSGLGSVIVRAGGNNRRAGENVADSAHAGDPRVIAVAGAVNDGRATATSEPGAPLLVAAPVQSINGYRLFTTDLTGLMGGNQIEYGSPHESLFDYLFESIGFSGTSAAAPQIAGIAALMLSANPGLSYRDVQHLMIQSARQHDLNDPDLRTNGAGYAVSHNVGFGIPDAGHAVRLAKSWPNRPAAVEVCVTNSQMMAIPDDSGALHISGPGVAANLASIPAAPGLGVFAEQPTSVVELVHVGDATASIAVDLTGKAALIQRDGDAPEDPWATQIRHAADAGAVFAVIYNTELTTNAGLRCLGGENLCVLSQTDYARIPAVSITQSKGEELVTLFAANSAARAQIAFMPLTFTINVSAQLICEHVGLRLRTDHPFRGDLRIMLTSPQGTRSILQVLGNDSSPGPIDWTYWSTHHFYESSAGDWTVTIIDQVGVNAGNVLEAVICLRGVPINDSDADGLDDAWETTWFGDLSSGPRDDPDNDGRQNAREQALGFHPNSAVPDIEFRMDRSLWREERGLFHPLGPAVALDRLSWPSRPGRTYAVMTNSLVHTPFTTVTNITGNFPVTEVFLPPPTGNKFYFIRETGN